MKNILHVAMAAAVLLTGLETHSADAKRKQRQRPKPVVSPTIHPDRSVTFRIKAPKATKVEVGGEFRQGRTALEKGTNGIWSVTVDPVEPGIYGYSFHMNGQQTLDPGNRNLKPMRSPKTSILHIPGGNPFDFDPKIPHGTVHYHVYHSKPINRIRELNVYTPPGYESSAGRKYPLLILQHGHSDSFATWVTYGKANLILDNLIAAGKSAPMIVAMLDGHPIPGSYGDGRSTANTEELRKDLMQQVIPMLERNYRLQKGSRNRAIAGLSMGGLHALSIGLKHSKDFATIGAFSAAIPGDDFLSRALSKPKQLNQDLELLWIAIGKKDFLLGENRRLIPQLEVAGIAHEFLLTEGGHSWPIWRDYLSCFAPLLFK